MSRRRSPDSRPASRPSGRRRVRHEARDGVAVIAFSAAASIGARPRHRCSSSRWPARRTDDAQLPATSRCCSTGSSPSSRPRSSGPGAVLVDATLGLGGHTEAVLDRCPEARVIGIDRDPHALERSRRAARRRSATGSPSCTRCTTRSPRCSPTSGSPRVDGVLFDLGVSSMQLDVRERGFAYAQDAPLDMRMDDTDGPDRGRRAQHLPGRRAGPDPARVRRGAVRPPDRRARSSASGTSEPFTSSARLVELVRDAIPAPARRTGGHPAKRTFQALRIEVNDELSRAAPRAPGRDRRARRRRPGGRDVLPLARGPARQAGVRRRAPRSDVPPDLPVVPEGHEPALRLVTRGCREGRRRRDRPRTPAPPRCGCGPPNASARTERHELTARTHARCTEGAPMSA